MARPNHITGCVLSRGYIQGASSDGGNADAQALSLGQGPSARIARLLRLDHVAPHRVQWYMCLRWSWGMGTV